jgi:hypothetical protein
MKRRRPVDLGTKVDDGSASHGISGAHRMDLVTQVDRLVVTVEVVCDTSSGTTTRVARRGSLIQGTKALDAQAR